LKENALEKVKSLETQLKATKEALSAAKKGESQAGKLENDLLAAKSDSELKANTILSLQQYIKELTTESKDLKDEIDKIQKAAAQEARQEQTNMRREHNDLISDLETKLRTTEREAGVREDALRHEVAELRKRWQDAVRRADGKGKQRCRFVYYIYYYTQKMSCSHACSLLPLPSSPKTFLLFIQL
jgi:TATA element modulatory factor